MQDHESFFENQIEYLITVRQLAQGLHIGESTVRKMVRHQQVPFCKVGGSIRFNWNKVIESFESKGM